MSGPRNRRAVTASQAVRGQIRTLLASRSQLLPLLSAKAVKLRLDLRISDRAVRWRLNAIRTEAERAELACRRGNSSVDTGSA